MIALISGKMIYKGASHVVIDVQGVGYRVFIPLSTFYELPEIGQGVSLHIHTSVREDAINLYGFYTEQERDLFQLMISVSGIGPRIAVNVLSGIAAPDLLKAISAGDVGKLVNIPGIGRKMAERLILELKEKVTKKMLLEQDVAGAVSIPDHDIIRDDALSALVNLGYKSQVAKDALEKVLRSTDGKMGMDELLKKTLNLLAG
jgi:Holliday junction DNA helicase RuvA